MSTVAAEAVDAGDRIDGREVVAVWETNVDGDDWIAIETDDGRTTTFAADDELEVETAAAQHEARQAEKARWAAEGASEPVGQLLRRWYPSATIDTSERDGTITLSRIVIPDHRRGEGIGSQVMDDLCDYADATGQQVACTPSSDFGGSKSRLEQFYRRFGFVPNKGRNRDFSTRETMIRPAA